MSKSFLVAILFVFAFQLRSNSQAKNIDPQFDLTTYQDFVWFNCDKPKDYLAQKDVLFLIVYWNNFELDAEESAAKIAEIKKNNPALKIVFLYNAIRKEEKNYAHFRTHLLRNNIQFPAAVVTDDDWIEKFKITKYPTAILYSPRYGTIQTYEGFQDFDNIEEDFVVALNDPRNEDLKKYSDNYHRLSDDYPDPLFSRFEYICPVEAKDWIFLSQPSLNRIILADVQGNILKVFGAGTPGITEGPISFIQFNHPQGMYWNEENQTLYVADTYNNCIRKFDFNANTSSTIPIASTKNAESRPADVAFANGLLYIAVQGLNQVWTMNLENDLLGVLKNVHGQSLQVETPSSIAIGSNSEIYLVEKSTGKVLMLDLDNNKSYLDFEYPISQIYFNEGQLFAVSAYGDKIYVTKNGKITETVGSKPGFSDGKFSEAKFLEPTDMAFMNGVYYVVDNGNSLIRMLNLKTKRVTTVEYENMGELCQRIDRPHDIIELEGINLASGYNQILVKVDNDDNYAVDSKFGVNQIFPGDFPSNANIEDADLNDKVGVLSIEGEMAQGVIEFVVILTYHSKDFPKKYYQKVQRYYLPVVMDASVEGRHEVHVPIIE